MTDEIPRTPTPPGNGATQVIWNNPVLDDPSGPGTLPVAHPVTGDGTRKVIARVLDGGDSATDTVLVETTGSHTPPDRIEGPASGATQVIDRPARRWQRAARANRTRAPGQRPAATNLASLLDEETVPMDSTGPLTRRETWVIIIAALVMLAVMLTSYWFGYLLGSGHDLAP